MPTKGEDEATGTWRKATDGLGRGVGAGIAGDRGGGSEARHAVDNGRHCRRRLNGGRALRGVGSNAGKEWGGGAASRRRASSAAASSRRRPPRRARPRRRGAWAAAAGTDAAHAAASGVGSPPPMPPHLPSAGCRQSTRWGALHGEGSGRGAAGGGGGAVTPPPAATPTHVSGRHPLPRMLGAEARRRCGS